MNGEEEESSLNVHPSSFILHPSLNILYEDESFIFVDKPAGVVVQRGYDPDEQVLLETVEKYLREKGQRAFLMQRLDRGTTGVMFFTKQSDLNRNVTRQFEEKNIRKIYLALCEGRLAEHQLIDAPLARTGPISFSVRSNGKRAITEVLPVEASALGSVVRVKLLTGRTHQIRVHLAAIGHPLVGDWLYGRRNAPRPMLHAESLEIRHPRKNEMIQVKARVPDDLLSEAATRGLNGRKIGGIRPINA